MDSLTQIVLGASVGEAVLGKKVGNKAALYGAIAGTIPDLDVLAGYFVDELTAVEWHRGFSHSILFSFIAAPIFGKLVSYFHKEATWKDWTSLFFLGLLTHPILDAFTTWGTQLFWPFDFQLAFQSIFVIDPLYTLPFLLFLILALRLPKMSLKRRKFNRFGLTMSFSYLMITLVLKLVSFQEFKAALENQNVIYEEMQTRPSPFNTVLWNANVKLENQFLLGDYSFFDTGEIQFRRFRQNEHFLGKFTEHPEILRLKKITKNWYTISKNENGDVFLNDLRFGLLSPSPNENNFVFSYYLFNEKNKILDIKETPKTRGDAKKLLAELWSRVKGN